MYACDYYKVDGRIPLPLRWAAWESVLRGKYTTKSDVWAFAVTLHEIFTLCRRRPYEHMTEAEVRLWKCVLFCAKVHHTNSVQSILIVFL